MLPSTNDTGLEDPAAVVFGFYDENAKPRNENVINLSCAVCELKGDVIHQMIVRGAEAGQYDVRQQLLATILE